MSTTSDVVYGSATLTAAAQKTNTTSSSSSSSDSKISRRSGDNSRKHQNRRRAPPSPRLLSQQEKVSSLLRRTECTSNALRDQHPPTRYIFRTLEDLSFTGQGAAYCDRRGVLYGSATLHTDAPSVFHTPRIIRALSTICTACIEYCTAVLNAKAQRVLWVSVLKS